MAMYFNVFSKVSFALYFIVKYITTIPLNGPARTICPKINSNKLFQTKTRGSCVKVIDKTWIIVLYLPDNMRSQ